MTLFEEILDKVSQTAYDLIYIDGDHSLEGTKRDIETYSKTISSGGYLVVDDASYFLEGTKFWKGYIEVSQSCEIMEKFAFKNILKVRHNRIYQKNS